MKFLKVDKVSKTYSGNEKPAVSSLAFSMKKGEIVSFVGASGSGKSTLLKMIGGLISPEKGWIHFQGKALEKPDDKLIPGEEGIKMVFQDLRLMLNHTVEENIKYPLLFFDKGYQNERVEELLEVCHLQEFRKRLPRELSGGQQQRLALAKTLAEEPALLLMDEPFSNLDPIVKSKLIVDVSEIIRNQQLSLIMVTHDTQDALMLSDKIGFMSEGKLIQYDSPLNIYNKPNSVDIAAFFGTINIFNNQEFQHFFGENLEIAEDQRIVIRAESFRPSFESGMLKLEGIVQGSFFKGAKYLIRLKVGNRLMIMYADQILKNGVCHKFYVDRHSLMVI
ncbi:ABC transporter ATP-binding protein [Roseivirga sp.]|uniref:ABC transporter ATP-binding protein n=1 Tax=Roseivirga sp. TaxID=1964215 RepID=UPI002B266647|nr:ABC transporter ATP-binding protein [Roseivirga sp.]